MATISFRKREIDRFIGKEVPVEQIVHSFEMLGMPVDKYDSEEIVADITNDRVDMFTVEGAGRAIGQFLGILKPKHYSLSKSSLVLNVEDVRCRPYIVGFVARNVELDDDMIRSLIMAQEKIHETFGRKRRKIAIGIHDADKVHGPLYYKPVRDIKFIPLDTDREMNVQEILTQHPKGQEYAHIFSNASNVSNSDANFNGYPMFMDSKGVLSFPPIINSERTRLTEKTRNLLFDITGTSDHAIRIVANIFATSLADRGATIENIELLLPDGTRRNSLEYERKEDLSLKFANKILGVKFKQDEVIMLLSKMGFIAEKKDKDTFTVHVPPYRADIMHEVDFVEDIAVAYGYDKFKPKLPKLSTIGSVSPQSMMDQKIREMMVALGFIEINSWTLTNEETMKKALMEDRAKRAVKIKNPRTQDFTMFRTDLTPSILQTLADNKTKGLPLKIFEVGRVADEKGNCYTNLCCAIMGENADFSQIATVLFEIKRFANVSVVYPDELSEKERKLLSQTLRHLIDGRYIFVREAEKMERTEKSENAGKKNETAKTSVKISAKISDILGWAGEIHPQVLENFKLEYPVAMLEFRLLPKDTKSKSRSRAKKKVQ